MSEAEGAEDEGEYESGRPTGLYLLVGVIVLLVVVSGMFAIGYIPPLLKNGTATTSTHGTAQFITITTTLAPVTSVSTVAGKDSTTTSTSVVTSTLPGATTTQTSTLTQTVSTVSTATVTSSTVVTVPTVSTTTTTQTTTTTATTTPTNPLTIDVAMNPSASPAVLHAGETFTITITIQNRLYNTAVSLYAYQVTPSGTPIVVSFYPQLPENVYAVVGTSYYTIQGTISKSAPAGNYEVDAEISGYSNLNGGAQTSVTKQFIIQTVEPLTFPGFSFPTPTAQFNGTCIALSFTGQTNPTWGWKCNVNAAPQVNGTIQFTVSNAANVAVCIQTTIGSSSMTGYVNMNPYPFCPDGGPGVYVPAGTSNWPFTFSIHNGSIAGAQVVYFTFTRSGS